MSLPAPSDDALLGAQRRDRTRGLLILGLSFGAALAVSFWAHEEAQAPPAPDPASVARVLPGWPHATEPMAALDLARRKTPLNSLGSLVFDSVKSDGTLDVTETGRARFVFFRTNDSKAQRNSAKGKRPSCDQQVVRLNAKGVVARDVTSGRRCPEPAALPLPDPPCGPRQLWELALRKGVRADARARIEYYRAASGPAWSFATGRGRPKFVMDGRCARQLTRAEARRPQRRPR